VPRFLQELRDHLRADETILNEIREKKDLSDDLVERLNAELERFVNGFNVEEEESPVAAAS
jgi:F0F1-type ATP synthase alpha subunit